MNLQNRFMALAIRLLYYIAFRSDRPRTVEEKKLRADKEQFLKDCG
jgi:hypothetical protein